MANKRIWQPTLAKDLPGPPNLHERRWCDEVANLRGANLRGATWFGIEDIGSGGCVASGARAISRADRSGVRLRSVAKGKDTAKSDIDLMVISEKVGYADLFAALEPATNRLQRTVNPTLYSRMEIDKRILDGNAFVKRVLAQPKLWVIGEGRGLAA